MRIYAYADPEIPLLARMFDRRCREYRAIGYRIVVPASAVAIWPADMPLPADPEWERDYAATVKRLIRNGVDGAQHLENVEVYRRDRRKDQLLQENGYFGLRFLAEDAGRGVDTVLDAILRTLTSRRKADDKMSGATRGSCASYMVACATCASRM